MFRQKWREISMGELADKISILMVKLDKLPSDYPNKYMVYCQERYLYPKFYNYCQKQLSKDNFNKVFTLMSSLIKNNGIQWDIEDQVIKLDGEAGLQAAKKSREYNLKRAEIKREIDVIFGEKYLEIKKYASTKQS